MTQAHQDSGKAPAATMPADPAHYTPLPVLGFDSATLDSAGATWTAREILQQPQLWCELDAQVRSCAVQAFLAPLLQKPGLRIALTGAGSSAFVGDCLAPALLTHLQRPVDALATTDLVSDPQGWLLPTVPLLLVSFARSGNSPESVAALDLAQQCVRDCHHLVITCNAEGALAQRARSLPNACLVVLPPQSNDRSFAMTSSFSCMLLAAALAFGLVEGGGQGVAHISRAAQGVLDHALPLLQELLAQKFERVVYLGAGTGRGLAREAALKLLELSDGQMIAIADTPLGFRHGPKTIVNGKALVVVFLGNDAYSRRYDLDLLQELRRDGVAGRVLALSGQGGPALLPGDLLLGPGQDLDALGLCLCALVFVQEFALLSSLQLGKRPDNPNAAGTVNRVVKGVTIYPLESVA